MDQSQRELRRAAAKAFMESLEQLGQEFQLPIDEEVEEEEDNENADPSIPGSIPGSIQIDPAPFEQFLDDQPLKLPLSSNMPLPEQDSKSV